MYVNDPLTIVYLKLAWFGSNLGIWSLVGGEGESQAVSDKPIYTWGSWQENGKHGKSLIGVKFNPSHNYPSFSDKNNHEDSWKPLFRIFTTSNPTQVIEN